MNKPTLFAETEPATTSRDALTEVLQQGAQQLLQVALEKEVANYIALFRDEVDDENRRLVVRNGTKPARTIQTGIGEVEVRQPRINDRRVDEDGNRIQFKSSILPPYLRRTKSLEELIPWLYLKGVSTGDFSKALGGLLGPDAAGLSASTIVRLKEVWQKEHQGMDPARP